MIIEEVPYLVLTEPVPGIYCLRECMNQVQKQTNGTLGPIVKALKLFHS
jgi:hypothetical protein